MSAGVALSCAAPASAHTGLQAGAGVSGAVDTGTLMLTGRASYGFPVFGASLGPEIEGSGGVVGERGDGSFSRLLVNGARVDRDARTERSIGGYARLSKSFGFIEPHIRFGFDSIRISEESAQAGNLTFPARQVSSETFAWGIGTTLWFGKHTGLRFDATRSDGLERLGAAAAFRF